MPEVVSVETETWPGTIPVAGAASLREGSTLLKTVRQNGRPVTRELDRLEADVAEACGFEAVPPVILRRGAGGDWSPERGTIRIGVNELSRPAERLWFLLAHELSHAQVKAREGHSMQFWRRFAEALKRAGRLDLIKYDIGYREGALRVAHEHAVPGIPAVAEFKLALGDDVVDGDGRRWVIARRHRRAGQPFYRLESPGWSWEASEESLLETASRA